MISWILKIKKNKLLFSLLIALAVVLLFDVVAIIINIVQIFQTTVNPTKLMNGFVIFNIVVAGINLFTALIVAIYIVIKRYSKLKV